MDDADWHSQRSALSALWLAVSVTARRWGDVRRILRGMGPQYWVDCGDWVCRVEAWRGRLEPLADGLYDGVVFGGRTLGFCEVRLAWFELLFPEDGLPGHEDSGIVVWL